MIVKVVLAFLKNTFFCLSLITLYLAPARTPSHVTCHPTFIQFFKFICILTFKCIFSLLNTSLSYIHSCWCKGIEVVCALR
jgi:hypothetical protein